MHTPLPIRLFALTVIAALAGCSSPPLVRVTSIADPAFAFPPTSSTSIEARVWRVSRSDSTKGFVVPSDQLTLEERNFLANVESALRQSGFAPTHEGAAMTMLAEMDTKSGMYDTYRRVPVMESSSGHIYTRDGYKPYHETTTTDVVVPERRPYMHRIITLTAIPSASNVDSLSPNSPAVIWRTTVASDAEVIDDDLVHHLSVALQDWGRSNNRSVKYKPADRD